MNISSLWQIWRQFFWMHEDMWKYLLHDSCIFPAAAVCLLWLWAVGRTKHVESFLPAGFTFGFIYNAQVFFCQFWLCPSHFLLNCTCLDINCMHLSSTAPLSIWAGPSSGHRYMMNTHHCTSAAAPRKEGLVPQEAPLCPKYGRPPPPQTHSNLSSSPLHTMGSSSHHHIQGWDI